MRRLTDVERDRAAAIHPSAVRFCRRYGRRRGLDDHQIEGAASLAAMDAPASPLSITSLAYRRSLDARRESVPKSWRNRPAPWTNADRLLAAAPCPPASPDSAALVAAVSALPGRQWQALDLVVMGGHDNRSASAILGITRQAVQNHLRSALRTLRIILEEPPCPRSPSPR